MAPRNRKPGKGSSQLNPQKPDRMATATLISAIVAALAGITGIVVSNVIAAGSQGDARRASAYNAYISQANTLDENLISSYDAVVKIYQPAQYRLALAYYQRLTSTAKSEFTTASEQLELVAPPAVDKAADTVNTAINDTEVQFVGLLHQPTQQSVTATSAGNESFEKAIKSFIRSAGGLGSTT